MELTKDEARKMLNDYFSSDMFTELPVKDFMFNLIESPEPKIATTLQEQEDINDRPLIISQVSFTNLLKIVYDLK